ncbi:MAG: tol-pal system YbgF family protein [Kiritimatiellia bacterium]
MKTTKLFLLGLAAALAVGAAGAAPYVELPNGTRVAGSAIRALANGDVNLTMEMGMRTFPKGTYVKAVADKPAEYDQAAAAMKAQKFAAAIPLLEGIVAKYRYLGWDVEAAKLLAQALLGKGDAEGAVKAYEQLFLINPAEKQNPDSAWGWRRAMLKAKQYPALVRQLDAVAAAGNRAEAARAQTMRGDIELDQNRVELAALDYLRTAILFVDVKDAAILGEATFKAAAALEQLRDPRAKDLYKKVVADYGASPYAAQARGKI